MNQQNRPPTINDVAALAGVSKRTVSRVINNSEKVNDKTRARVQKVIEELNFKPNRHARGLAARRSYLIGLVYDEPSLFINSIQKGILSICSDAGYELVVHVSPWHSDHLIDEITAFVSRSHLDGVIILPPVSEIGEVGTVLNEAGYPCVQFTSDVGDEPWKMVVSDYQPAIDELTRHLVDLGHRDIGFISGPSDRVASQKRHECFIKALQTHGLELRPEWTKDGGFTFEGGMVAARDILTSERRPTAIFAANDEIAFGVMNVAHELGLKIPDDLSLIGFDGSRFSTFVVPSLSTVIRDTDAMARLGTQKLLALIEEGPEAARMYKSVVSPSFVSRESTGPVPVS